MSASIFIFIGLISAGIPAQSSEGAVYPNGDLNGDGKIDLADSIYLLEHLFWAGPLPLQYICGPCDSCCPELSRPLSTGVTRCLDPKTGYFMEKCLEEGEYGYGQDGNHQAGVSRRGQYVVATLGEADNHLWITVDYATGLMWQYRPYWVGVVNYCENLKMGPFEDWRNPNIFELLSLLLYPIREYPDPTRPETWPLIKDKAAMDANSFYVLGDKTGLISTGYPSSTLGSCSQEVYCVHYRRGIFTLLYNESVRCVRAVQPGDLEILGLPPLGKHIADPLKNGDTNGDRKLDIADAIYLLQNLFTGGPEPFAVFCPGCDTCCKDFPARPLVTGVTRCFNGPFQWPCDKPESIGQDGYHQAGLKREFRLGELWSADPAEWVTADLVTGLLWQYKPHPDRMTWEEALDYCESLELAGFDDWRLPNFFEFMTLINFGRCEPSPTYWEFFEWPEFHIHWTSTTVQDLELSHGAVNYIAVISIEGPVFMQLGDPQAKCCARAVRTLKPGDLEMLGLR